jgi:hypothetical protein
MYVQCGREGVEEEGEGEEEGKGEVEVQNVAIRNETKMKKKTREINMLFEW